MSSSRKVGCSIKGFWPILSIEHLNALFVFHISGIVWTRTWDRKGVEMIKWWSSSHGASSRGVPYISCTCLSGRPITSLIFKFPHKICLLALPAWHSCHMLSYSCTRSKSCLGAERGVNQRIKQCLDDSALRATAGIQLNPSHSLPSTLLCALKHNWRAAIFVISWVERLTYILKSENQECALQEEAAIQIEFIRRDNFQYWSLPLIAEPQILLWLNLRNNNPDHQPLQAVGAHCKFSCAICAWDWWRMIASGGNLRFYLWLQKSTTGLLSIPGSAPGWLSNCNILIQMLHQCRFMCQFKKKKELENI